MLLAMAGDAASGFVSERLSEAQRILAALDTGELSHHVELPEVDIRTGYAVWSSTYDADDNPLIAVEEPVVTRFLAEVPCGRALDVACGTSRVARILAALGHEVAGLDSSLDMLAAGDGSGALVAAELQSLPVAPGTVDVVTCCLALTHQPDLVPAFAEFARVIRTGGTLVTSDIHVATLPLGGVARVVVDGVQYVLPAFRWWASDYIRAAGESGFDVVDCAEPRWGGDAGGGDLAMTWCPDAAAACYAAVPAAIVWRSRRR